MQNKVRTDKKFPIARLLASALIGLMFKTVVHASTPVDLEPSMSVRLKPIELSATAAQLIESNEVYSEAFYQNTQAGASEMLRVRHEYPLGTLATRLYLGAVLERSFNAEGAAPMLENATSPELGVLYRPLSYMTIWGEYRYRAAQAERSLQFKRAVSDPRVGIAAGRIWASAKKRFDTEVYGEIVTIPRFTVIPSTSGFVRSEWNAGQFKRLTLSIYTELNEFTSPDLQNLGPGRLQFRGGGRGSVSFHGWTGSLFTYRPITLSSMGSPAGHQAKDGLEGFLVFGGRF